MIIVVDHRNADKYAGYLEEMHKLRRAEYIERQGWVEVENPARPDLEIDQYDNTRLCRYLLVLDEDDWAVQGAVRLTPTVFNTLTTDYFEDAIQACPVPNSMTHWEVSRFFRADKDWTGKFGPAESELAIGMLEYCAQEGVERLIGIYHPALLTRVQRMPWQIEYLGTTDGNDAYVVADIIVSPAMVQQTITESKTGITRSRLQEFEGIVPARPSAFRAEDVYSEAMKIRLETIPENARQAHMSNLVDIYKAMGAFAIGQTRH